MNIYSAISTNIWKSYIILVLFITFAGTVAYVLSKGFGYDPSIGISVFIISLIYSFVSYFFSDKMVLAASGAQEIQEKDNPELFHIVENLAIGDGVPMPRVYIIND